jgi:hypothetical protein
MPEPIPSNAMSPNDFLEALGQLLHASKAKDTGVAKVRTIRARFEKMGANLRALDLMLKLRNMESDDQIALLEDTLRYCRWANMPVGSQADLFGKDTAKPSADASASWTRAQAYEEGYSAGKAGRSGTDHRFTPGTPTHQGFYEGWCDGQAVLAEQLGQPLPTDGTYLKPAKKEQATPAKKKGTTDAPSAPRGRPRRASATPPVN